MIDRLRQPGGRLGTLSVTSALVLGIVGVAGVVSLCLAVATGSHFWSDDPTVQLISAIMFGFIADGAIGFLIMDRRPWLGVTLAVFGCIVFTYMLLWLLLPIVLGPLFAVTAINRAKVLSELEDAPPAGDVASDGPA